MCLHPLLAVAVDKTYARWPQPNPAIPAYQAATMGCEFSLAEGVKGSKFQSELKCWLLQLCLAFQGREQRGTSSIEQLSSANCKYKEKINRNPVTGWFGSGLGVEAFRAL